MIEAKVSLIEGTEFESYTIVADSQRERAMTNQVGKRYVCGKCGSEFIVTKAGSGTLACCGQPMSLKS